MEYITTLLISILSALAVSGMLYLFGKYNSPGGLFERFILKRFLKRYGITKSFKNSKDFYPEVASDLKTSKTVYILQIRGQDLISKGRSALLKEAIHERNLSDYKTKILLLNPFSRAVDQRATEIQMDAKSFRRGIQSSIEELGKLIKEGSKIEVRVFNTKPIFSFFIFNERLFLSFYIKNKDRQNSLAFEIHRGATLYEVFTSYFKMLWEKQDSPFEVLRYHHEVELKCRIKNVKALVKSIEKHGGTFKGKRLYHDLYFTNKVGEHAESSGMELRLRGDLLSDRLFLTEKKPFSMELGDSKLERESYIGGLSSLKNAVEILENRGFQLYVDFYKSCDVYHIHYGAYSIELVLASARKNKDEINDKLKKEFIEIEAIELQNASEEILRNSYSTIDKLRIELGDSISRITTQTYSGKFVNQDK